jgi:PAS domain S-box-containing protein
MSRVLIVDDREDSRYLLKTLLTANGCQVDVALNGAEALEQARQNPPQLVVSDLLMPVMDGYTLLRLWKADERLGHIPFAVYTATYTDPKDEQLALNLGADAFILKPAEPDVLIARIQEILARPPSNAVPPRTELSCQGRIPISAPEEEEARNLKQYSEVLIHKLEDKMEEADRANRELQRDISERRRIEQSRSQLAAAVQQAAEAIVITDTRGAITYVNPAFEKITGYSRAEAIGQNPRILKSGRHDDAFYRRLWKTITGGNVWSGRIINRKKDGTLYPEEVSISPIRDEAGRIVSFVAVKHDVTPEAALETRLRQAQKMEAVGLLAGGVAHDFNNILTVIHGNASMMLSEKLAPAELADCAEQIINAAARAASLTRQLLVFSSKQIMQPANLDLSAVVGGMVKMLKRLLGEDVTLRSELSPNLPPIFADAGMIEQVLLNLAVNARDAMPGGGVLTIATGRLTLDEAQARLNPSASPGECVWLRVSDNGCGIPPEVRPRIFEPFFTTKAVGKGTGLGLATVYGIVEQHHGWLDLASEPGKGTTFQIHFPAVQGSRMAPKPQPAEAGLPHGTETVLAVEDDSALRLLVCHVLERCGYTVFRASTGGAAAQLWAQHRDTIDLLVTDLVLPEGMSGFELARKLQADKPDLKVIFTSGYASRAGEGPPLIEGVNFLQKPYSPRRLAETVRSRLDPHPDSRP